jgi:hypothetical protein
MLTDVDIYKTISRIAWYTAAMKQAIGACESGPAFNELLHEDRGRGLILKKQNDI